MPGSTVSTSIIRSGSKSIRAGWLLAVPFGLGPVGIWLGFGIGLSLAGVALVLRFRTRTSGQVGGIVSQTVSPLR